MKIRMAEKTDSQKLIEYDKHIRAEELESVIVLKRVLIAEEKEKLVGWLRWSLFWDNTPFINML